MWPPKPSESNYKGIHIQMHRCSSYADGYTDRQQSYLISLYLFIFFKLREIS
jgi:hypothetical protein